METLLLLPIPRPLQRVRSGGGRPGPAGPILWSIDIPSNMVGISPYSLASAPYPALEACKAAESDKLGVYAEATLFLRRAKGVSEKCINQGKTCCFPLVCLPPAPTAPEQPNGILPTLREYRWAGTKGTRTHPEGSGSFAPQKLYARTSVSLQWRCPGPRHKDEAGPCSYPASSRCSAPRGIFLSPEPLCSQPSSQRPFLTCLSSFLMVSLGNNHSQLLPSFSG